MTKKRAVLSFDKPVAVPNKPAKSEQAVKSQATVNDSKKEPKKQVMETATEEKRGARYLGTDISEEAMKQWKILGATEGKQSKALIIEAVNDLFTKYGLSRIA